MAFLDVDQPKTPVQWIIWLAAMGIVMTSPLGAVAIVGSLREELTKRKGFREKEISPQNLSQALYYAKKRKLIKIRTDGDKTTMILTEKGKKRKLEYDFNAIEISRPEGWDGRWRMLMFDIPEKEKSAREALRDKLIAMGFVLFQKSIWIYPYSCENEVDFIGEALGIGKYLHLLTARIDNDQELRSKFNLSA